MFGSVVYGILFILSVSFIIITVLCLALSVSIDSRKPLITAIIAIILFVGCIYGKSLIVDANTTTTVEVVQMEITKCDIVVSNDNTQPKYYIIVGNVYVVTVGAKEYADLNVGDIVLVEITNKTVFGEVQEPIITLRN